MPQGRGERMLQPALPSGALFYHSKPEKFVLTQDLCSLKWQDSLLEIDKQPLGHGIWMVFYIITDHCLQSEAKNKKAMHF